jgi:AhpD family alkylhydroperoxidase
MGEQNSGGKMGESIGRFQEFHEKMNERIMDSGNLEIKRFFALDKNAYKEGALSAQTKELLGLVASLVLRCNDCINYHLLSCAKLGVSDAQFYEAFNVALVVGGSIMIPHLRGAAAFLDEIREEAQARG